MHIFPTPNIKSGIPIRNILILTFFCAMSCMTAAAQPSRTSVNTQAEFDEIMRKAAAGTAVNALLAPGTYTSVPSRILKGSISISGEGVVITQKNKTARKSDAVRETDTHYVCRIADIAPFSLFSDKEGNLVRVSEDTDPRTEVNVIPADIIPIKDGQTSDVTEIKFRIPENLTHLRNKTFDRAYGYIDSWWTAPGFTVTAADREYIYAILEQKRTSNQTATYINGERHQYKENATCVIFNTSPQPGRIFFTKEEIFIPKQYEEIEIISPAEHPLFILQGDAEAVFKGVAFENVTWLFKCDKDLRGEIELEDCTFRNILKRALGTDIMSEISHVAIRNCTFEDCAFIDRIPLIAVTGPVCTGIIEGNTFNHYPRGLCAYKNTTEYIYINSCDSFTIADNTFINHPRGGLYLLDGQIDVTANHLYNDSTFNSHPERNFSRDAGAIYCSRLYDEFRHRSDKPSRIRIKLNRIHDVYGRGDVRGIFIDDGRGDVECYGNAVWNGESYSIDARVTASDPYSSIRNSYRYNIVDRPYRLMYGDKVEARYRPGAADNVLLFNVKENTVSELSTRDRRTTGFTTDDGNLSIDRKLWKKLPKDVRSTVKPLN